MIRLLACAVAVAIIMNWSKPAAASEFLHGSQLADAIQVGRDYLLALNTADEFLHAWLKRDWMEGPEYLTRDFRERAGEQAVKSFFSGVSNPHHQGYEIVGTERVASNVVRFHIRLYEYYTDTNPPPEPRPAPLDLDLEKVSEWSWKVKDFPKEHQD